MTGGSGFGSRAVGCDRPGGKSEVGSRVLVAVAVAGFGELLDPPGYKDQDSGGGSGEFCSVMALSQLDHRAWS
ncbi:MAG: hypothetical protein AMS22_09340 [Thiotrichales bacterium SG8_50]|nr:MAG: hypothetical protein AMS22_09340 [Thiotrichales bacterium SG8_50]